MGTLTSGWDSGLYLQFADERTQPAIDLVARVPLAEPRRIVDLGCGPGNSTEVLRRRWPTAQILGLDNSLEMITRASRDYPEGHWELGDIAGWMPDFPYELIFSNAALHWVPNHAIVLPHLMRQVIPGGILAMQIPIHTHSPVHKLMREIADHPRWARQMLRAKFAITGESPGFYYDVLQPLTIKLELWETEYNHIMESSEAIIQWISATGLRPYLDVLDNTSEREHFKAMLLEGVKKAYPRQRDGKILFPFRRLFLIAHR
jgi:trans-aconitate 2-methyltransferase